MHEKEIFHSRSMAKCTNYLAKSMMLHEFPSKNFFSRRYFYADCMYCNLVLRLILLYATIICPFRFLFEKTSVRENTWLIIVTLSFSKSSVFKMSSVCTWKRKAVVFQFLGLKSVFDKLRFRDGLVWRVSLKKQSCVFKFLCRSVDAA